MSDGEEKIFQEATPIQDNMMMDPLAGYSESADFSEELDFTSLEEEAEAANDHGGFDPEAAYAAGSQSRSTTSSDSEVFAEQASSATQAAQMAGANGFAQEEWEDDKTQVLSSDQNQGLKAAWLVGPQGEIIRVDQFPFSIGRAKDNHLVVNDPSISRKHIEIQHESGRFIASDLMSVNGLKVNGYEVDRVVLEDFDDLTIGEYHLTFRRNDPAKKVQMSAAAGMSMGSSAMSSTAMPAGLAQIQAKLAQLPKWALPVGGFVFVLAIFSLFSGTDDSKPQPLVAKPATEQMPAVKKSKPWDEVAAEETIATPPPSSGARKLDNLVAQSKLPALAQGGSAIGLPDQAALNKLKQQPGAKQPLDGGWVAPSSAAAKSSQAKADTESTLTVNAAKPDGQDPFMRDISKALASLENQKTTVVSAAKKAESANSAGAKTPEEIAKIKAQLLQEIAQEQGIKANVVTSKAPGTVTKTVDLMASIEAAEKSLPKKVVAPIPVPKPKAVSKPAVKKTSPSTKASTSTAATVSQAKQLLSLADQRYAKGEAPQVTAELKKLVANPSVPRSLQQQLGKKLNQLAPLYTQYEQGLSAYESGNKEASFASWEAFLSAEKKVLPEIRSRYAKQVSDYVVDEYVVRAKSAQSLGEHHKAYQLWQNAVKVGDSEEAKQALEAIEIKAQQFYREALRYEFVNVAKSIELWEAVVQLVPATTEYHTKANSKLAWYARWGRK